MFFANLVADLTRGRPILGLTCPAAPPVEVLMLGCEDAYEDTIVPRLLSADADMDRVVVVDGYKDSAGHVSAFLLDDLAPAIDQVRNNPRIGAFIIDSVTGFVGRTGVKDHNEAELRTILEPLAALANECGIMVMMIKNLNKDEGRSVLNRVSGSHAYIDVPRAAFVVADDPQNDTRRVLAVLKWNLNVPRPPAVAWSLASVPDDLLASILGACDHLTDGEKQELAGQLQRLVWEGMVNLVADDLLQPAIKAGQKAKRDELDNAAQWLAKFLAKGPEASIYCAREGDRELGRTWPDPTQLTEEAYNKRVLSRVKWWRRSVLMDRLGGGSKKAEFGGPWFFRLPDHEKQGLWPPSTEAIERSKHTDNNTHESIETWDVPVRDSPG
jgi:hypothetical protein